MWQILRYLRKYPYDGCVNQMENWKARYRGIGEESFRHYLLFKKNYREHWISTLRKYWEVYIIGYQTTSLAGGFREQERFKVIEMAIEGCREKGYLEPKDQNGLIKITSKGWRFSGPWMGGFINEFLKEYSTAELLIAGVIGGIPFGAIILWLFRG